MYEIQSRDTVLIQSRHSKKQYLSHSFARKSIKMVCIIFFTHEGSTWHNLNNLTRQMAGKVSSFKKKACIIFIGALLFNGLGHGIVSV